MNEFEIIRRFFTRAPGRPEGLSVGIGDDAAVVRIPTGQELVLAMDSLIQGVHFPHDTPPADIGWKALAVNLSDLAAMGAEPRWATLSLTLPEADETWLKEFSDGLFELAGRYRVDLIGGDLCRGPLSVTIQVHGLVPAGQAITRTGAKPGDRVFVTGTLGDAGYALSEAAATGSCHDYFFRRLNRPDPRVEVGMAIRGVVNSAIDISDGLVSDIRHILDASGLGAELQADKLPLSEPLITAIGRQQAISFALSAGDDYELCVTVAESNVDRLELVCHTLDIPVSHIGVVTSSPGLNITGIDMQASGMRNDGYRHFA
jgi:thiamine-monophosphate kinase